MANDDQKKADQAKAETPETDETLIALRAADMLSNGIAPQPGIPARLDVAALGFVAGLAASGRGLAEEEAIAIMTRGLRFGYAHGEALRPEAEKLLNGIKVALKAAASARNN